MPVPVIYPKVSLEETSGRISRWLVADGATVTTGQVLFEIENDKAAVEVEAPADGILSGPAAEGEMVEVGSEVARILLPGEVAAPVAAPAPRPAAVAQPVVAVAAGPVMVPVRRAPNPTPLARRIARESGLALDGLRGTGPHGRVQKKDVLARLNALAAHPETPPAAEGTLNAVWLRRGEGLPVVLLHGYSADLNNWRGLFAGARVDWPVLALDLPAHGGSPRDLPADLDALAEQVEATLAQLGVTAFVLGGHSFGAAAAARIAARRRADVRGLFLFAPAGLGPQINQPFTEGILRASRAASLRPWLEYLVHDPRVISDAFVKAVVSARADEGFTQAMAAFAARFFPDGTQSFAIGADLAALRIPARVAFGRQDRILPFDSTRGLPGNIGLHALNDCGHMPHLEQPELALRLLAELVRSAG